MSYKIAFIGVGNMARAIISGIQKSDINISEIYVFDKNEEQYTLLENGTHSYVFCKSAIEAAEASDCIVIAVKPQNYTEILGELLKSANCDRKLYISIGAGISVSTVSKMLDGANVVRVLPNLPMTVGAGVSVICKNSAVSQKDFSFVCEIFNSAGSTVLIEEEEMNRMIGVTSSSPAYVFKFIDSIYKGAIAQGLSQDGLINSICDVFIGAAMLLKNSSDTPETLISQVCSKGGTTEQAMIKIEQAEIEKTIIDAMIACTNRADELGKQK